MNPTHPELALAQPWLGRSLPLGRPLLPPPPATHAQAAQGKACVVVVNKWDTIPSKTGTTLADYEANVRAQVLCYVVLH